MSQPTSRMPIAARMFGMYATIAFMAPVSASMGSPPMPT